MNAFSYPGISMSIWYTNTYLVKCVLLRWIRFAKPTKSGLTSKRYNFMFSANIKLRKTSGVIYDMHVLSNVMIQRLYFSIVCYNKRVSDHRSHVTFAKSLHCCVVDYIELQQLTMFQYGLDKLECTMHKTVALICRCLDELWYWFSTTRL